jgi:tetratricopeptide (TPR) repeat protein
LRDKIRISGFILCGAGTLLGQLDGEEVLPELFEALEDTSSISFHRGLATIVLGQLGNKAAIPRLLKALEDADSSVRSNAAEALGNLGNEAAIPGLLKALAVEDEKTSVLKTLDNALRKLSREKVILGLRQLLQYPSWNIRWRATLVLGQLGCKEALPELREGLRNENSGIRETAATVLRQLSSREAIPELLNTLRDDQVYSVRRAAAISLGQLGIEEAIPELLKALRYYHLPDDCRTGTQTSVRLDSGEVIQKLITTLEDPDDSVRQSADEVIGNIGRSTLISHLWQMRLAGREELDFTIEAIQNRCKFYNYKIAVSPPPQEESKVEHLAAPIDMQQYEEILSVISNMVTVMERNPKTFEGIEEEALRDHFLVQLNGKYKGQATGETFNKKGKTYI